MGACISSSVEEPAKPEQKVEPVQKPEQKPEEPAKPHFLKRVWKSVRFAGYCVGWNLYYIFGFMAPDMNFICRPEGTDYWSLSRCEKNAMIYLAFMRFLVWVPIGTVLAAPFLVIGMIIFPFTTTKG
jgi:hypothetical protein